MDGLPKCLATESTITDDCITRLRNESVKASRRHYWLTHGMLLLLTTTALAFVVADTTASNFFAFAGITVLAAILMLASLAKGAHHCLTAQALHPVATSPNACHEALAFIKRSPAACDWRDKALASGRQLYLFDVTIMRGLANQATQEEVATRNSEVCRELHGISA